MSGVDKLLRKKRIKAMTKKRKASKLQASNLQESRIPKPVKTNTENDGFPVGRLQSAEE